MNSHILTHYLDTGTHTYIGNYQEYFRTLPDDIRELGPLVCAQVIHPVLLDMDTPKVREMYGDLSAYPKYRLRNEDDFFVTAISMVAELFRLDPRGFVPDRKISDKLVITCRYAAVLMNAVVKAKGIPCRARAGYYNYWPDMKDHGDHWINEMWCEKSGRWIAFDAGRFFGFEEKYGYSQYDIPHDKFAWAAEVWLGIRRGELDGQAYNYWDSRGVKRGRHVAVRQLFYDFHSLMNNETPYFCMPKYVYGDKRIDRLTNAELSELDRLAELMLDPDKNFPELKALWETKDKFRIMSSPYIEEFED